MADNGDDVAEDPPREHEVGMSASREEHEMLEVWNRGVGAMRVGGGGENARKRFLACGNVADEECASSDFLGRSVVVWVGIVGSLDRCRTANGRRHAFGARPLAEGRKSVIEDVVLVVGIWVCEKVLFDIERGRGPRMLRED